jgi:hypothetical protein
MGVLAALVLAGILAQGCSDNNGRVTGTESKVTGDAVGGSVRVSVTISPGIINVGRRGSVVVIVSSPNGFPLPGRRVDLSSTGGSLDATTGITDSSGRFSTTVLVTCGDAGTVTVTAFADNQSQVAATATANVAATPTSPSASPCPPGSGTPPAGGGGGGGGGGGVVLPTVSITAAGTATEGGATATFTVSRTGSTAAPLGVTLGLGGSATFGSDYGLTGTVGNTVTIPAGASNAVITLNPVNDTDDDPNDPSSPGPDSELAILTITPAGTYTVGTPSAAQVPIADND